MSILIECKLFCSICSVSRGNWQQNQSKADWRSLSGIYSIIIEFHFVDVARCAIKLCSLCPYVPILTLCTAGFCHHRKWPPKSHLLHFQAWDTCLAPWELLYQWTQKFFLRPTSVSDWATVYQWYKSAKGARCPTRSSRVRQILFWRPF